MREANMGQGVRLIACSALALAIALPALVSGQAPAAPPAPAAGQAPAGQRGGGPGVPPGPGRGGAGAGAGARAGAPVDLTGTWVSLVTEDWIERMSPESPPSGVVNAGPGFGGGGGGRGGGRGGGVPSTNDPCRVYGAGGSMRVPGRLNIAWADDNALKVEMDAGTQTRLFRFNAAAAEAGPRSLQGNSVATWETGGRGGGGFGGGGGGGRGGAPAAPRWGSLKVVTTNMTGGHLLTSRNNYSENAVLNEYFTRHTDFGIEYLTVTAVLEDGGQTRVTSSDFKKEPNNSKFAPSGCEIVK